MKKLYILAAGLLALLAVACNKDDSTAAGPVVTLKVTGLKDTFNLYTHQDFLKVAPTVENESSYDYYWTLFSTNFAASNSLGIIKPDTIGRTKDLNYEVLKDPGAYILVFNAKERNSGVVRQVTMVANITTLTLNGWYLVKDNGGTTDMDFIYNGGRINNWIANFNGGKSQDGAAVQAVFVPQFKTTLTTQNTYSAIAVVSSNDVGIYRVDNGMEVMNFDNMFFSKPTVKKPQAVFQPISTSWMGLINDGKFYPLAKGTLFANAPQTLNGISYTNLSPLTANVALDLGWDPVRRSMFGYTNSSFQELKVLVNNGVPNGVEKLQKVNGNLQWMAGYTGGRSVAMVLFRNPQDTGYFYKLNGSYGPIALGNANVIMNADTLKPQHGLMNASIICGNYDVDLIYYVTNGNVNMMDVASASESVQFTLPAGETVTAMQHIKFPEPVGTPVPVTTLSYMAIATNNAGHYKVYLCPISGTGTISLPAQPAFTGDGRITTMIYMEKGAGTRVF
jgi:hypothetical protein